ncbi:MAG: TrmH family RNA methyltransferase [Microcystaceae cyanobacterium]
MITSNQNPLIKEIRKLQRSKGRREQNRLLIEGTHLIETASKLTGSLDRFCYTEAWQTKNPQLWREVCQKSQQSQLVSPEVLASLATTVNPDGAIATLNRDICYSQPLTNPSLGLVLERLQDPGNLGTMMRTAVATGVEGLWVSEDTVELDNPKVLRASAGSWFHLPKTIAPDLPALLTHFKQQGIQVIATLPTAQQCYWEVDFSRPSVLLFGNEGNGLTADLANLADRSVTIPQRQEIESLNVAIAASVLLYEVQRQRWS